MKVFAITALLTLAGCSTGPSKSRPVDYDMLRVKTVQMCWPQCGWEEYCYRLKIPTWIKVGQKWEYR